MWFKNISQEFRLKEIDETEFDFIEEINQIVSSTKMFARI